jgi:uncharacterized heparinase superfamily protein
MLSWLLLMFHTVRYLRPIQIYSRIKFKLYRPSIDRNIPPNIRIVNDCWNTPIQHKSPLLSRWKFRFLNEEHSVKKSDDWDNPKLTKLWRYNLHYFDDLNALGANSRVDWHKELLIKWVNDNPPTLGTGWEPYPSSLRIINWIKWGVSGNELPKECIHSLAIQTRWLSKHLEFHILGNHLFANAKALVFAGLFFEGKEADEWIAEGLKILEHEISEQVLPDGGHFELSPMYHAVVLEDLLDLINVVNLFKAQIREGQLLKWKNTVYKMIFWLQNMSHPDGKIAFFNDAAFEISATVEELKKYAKFLGVKDVDEHKPFTYLAESGYIRVEHSSATGLLDIALIGPDYLPGHAHADTLSFELSLFGQRVFVNSGVSRYGNDSIRHKQRSTISHNTVCINGKNSSEVWSGFRVANRAYPSTPKIIKSIDKIKVSCAHDGYKRLPGKCIHEREWEFGTARLCIKDKVSGSFENATAKFYIHPDVKVKFEDSNKGNFSLMLVSGQILQVKVNGADSANLVASEWFPEFGVNLNNQCITVNFTSSEISVSISW